MEGRGDAGRGQLDIYLLHIYFPHRPVVLTYGRVLRPFVEKSCSYQRESFVGKSVNGQNH